MQHIPGGVDLSLLDAIDGVAYVVDVDGVIRTIGATNWQAFARENDVPALEAVDALIGKSLFDFIAGETVRDTYRFFLRELLDGMMDRLTLENRCDAPGLLRLMHMSITPMRNDGEISGFLFQNVLVESFTRPPMAIFAFANQSPDSSATDDRPVVGMCSFCQRIASLPGSDPRGAPDANGWEDAEAYYRKGGTSDVRISHAVCDECASRHLQLPQHSRHQDTDTPE